MRSDFGGRAVWVGPVVHAISGGHGGFTVGTPEVAHEGAVGAGDEDAGEVALLQAADHVVEEGAGSGGRRSVAHELFDWRVGLGLPDFAVKETEDDALVGDNGAEIPAECMRLFVNL